MPQLARRIGRAKPSAIMQVAEKAKRLKAEGRDIISFSIGVPNFLPGEHVYAADVTLPSGVTLVSDPELLVINVSEPVEQDLGEEPEAEDAEGETAQESAGESSDDE